MATPAENIASLETALATGTLEVRVDGKSVKYASAGDIKIAIEYFRNEARKSSGATSVKARQGAIYRG